MLLYFLMYKLGTSIGNMISLSVFNFNARTSFKTFKLVLTETKKTYSFENFFAFGEITLANSKQKSIVNVSSCNWAHQQVLTSVHALKARNKQQKEPHYFKKKPAVKN